ncbi:MAG: helix-turn-helix transcriptional regulator [Hamadaea sp.]|nr:helix-turn-helix transcriptional regulator [Hamadaea sp.]
MAISIDITGVPQERFLFAPSPLAELTSMLHALSEPGHHPALHGWVAATSASLKPHLSERLIEADFLWRSSRADFFVPSRPHATLAEELDDIDRLDDEAYVSSALLTTTCGAAKLYRRFSREKALERALARGPRQAEFAERLLADPPRVRAWVRRLLEDCEQAFFAESWARVQHRLAADSRQKADLLAHRGLSAVLDAVSPSVSLEGDRIVIDKLQNNATSAHGSGVTFLPTAFGHPHLLVVHAPGWRPVIQYPVAEPGVPQPISLQLVQRRIDALAHPVRRRLARTLARGSHTTGELADAWQLTAPEVSRHLAVLKKAGLVTVSRRGRYVLYQLDLTVCARLGADFVEAVLR